MAIEEIAIPLIVRSIGRPPRNQKCLQTVHGPKLGAKVAKLTDFLGPYLVPAENAIVL